MKARTTLRKALDDPRLLGSALEGESWAAWRILLMAALGEPLKPPELDRFRQLTGRDQAPSERVTEFWAIVGRRGGKSRAIAVLASYLATLCDVRANLVPGETGVVLCIAPSQTQAEIVLNYIGGILAASPILSKLVVRQTSETIELKNRIVIEVRSASFRRLRGPTCVAVIADEAAFWHSDESNNPDTEILNAVRPSLGTTGGPLIVISSPYARRGEVWEAYRRHYGLNGDPQILVAKGSTRDLNPSYSQAKIDREYERDAAHAAAEYGAEFRTDLESFVDAAVIANCVDAGVHERPYDPRLRYFAFTDPSGGSSDSFSLAIGHREAKTAVIDVIREVRPPFSPEQTVADFCKLLKGYRVNSVRGDRYAGEWPREQFRKWGISYEPSEKTKSELYIDALPLLNSHLAALPDNVTLTRQLTGLERRTSRAGKDSIDHPPGGRDDVANAVAGVLVTCAENSMAINDGKWNTDMRVLMAGLPGPEGRLPGNRYAPANLFHSSLNDGICDFDRTPPEGRKPGF
jgi:hypothetical protein